LIESTKQKPVLERRLLRRIQAAEGRIHQLEKQQYVMDYRLSGLVDKIRKYILKKAGW